MAREIVTTGREALAMLEREEPLNWWRSVPKDAYRAEQGSHVARAALVAEAEKAGFRFLGRYSFAGMFGRRPLREGWVDALGIVRLSMRAENTRDPIARAMSHYYLSTTFDDGSAIVTWSQSPAPIGSTPRAEARGGTGNIEADYAQHLEAVRTRNSLQAISVGDLDTHLALATWFDSRLGAAGAMRWSIYLQAIACVLLALGLVLDVLGTPYARWSWAVAIGAFALGIVLGWVRPLLLRGKPNSVRT